MKYPTWTGIVYLLIGAFWTIDAAVSFKWWKVISAVAFGLGGLVWLALSRRERRQSTPN